MMKNILKSIINDTLKNSKGKWSRKSLTMLASFIMANITGMFILVFSIFTRNELNPYAIQVYFGFLATGVGTSVLTIWDKFKNGDSPKYDDNNNLEN